MQWDVGLQRALGLTFLISGASAFLATAIACVLASAVVTLRIPGRAWIAAFVGSFLIIPVYVQATAWSAGFGSQGWLRLSQVDAAKHPWMGIAAVTWIHAAAAVPACFLILVEGTRRVRNGSLEQAWSEFGPTFVLVKFLPRAMLPWIAGAFLWAFSMAQNDMVVTNLFQIPTLCESVYQQVQFGMVRPTAVFVAITLACVLGTLLAGLAWVGLRARSLPSVVQPQWNPVLERLAPIRLGIGTLAWILLGVTLLVPWFALGARMGWEIQNVNGLPSRSWTWNAVLSNLWHVADYGEELRWSLAISVGASLLAMMVAIFLVAVASSPGRGLCLMVFMGILLSMPGPIINLAVLTLGDSLLPGPLQFLATQTLLLPILALQSRCLPLAFGMLWLMRQRYRQRHADLLEVDAALPWTYQQWIWLRYGRGTMLTAAIACFLIAFGDLSSYLLVQPPGVTTVAMRMFDLLHYGTRNREASLALVLSMTTACIGTLVVRRLDSQD